MHQSILLLVAPRDIGVIFLHMSMVDYCTCTKTDPRKHQLRYRIVFCYLAIPRPLLVNIVARMCLHFDPLRPLQAVVAQLTGARCVDIPPAYVIVLLLGACKCNLQAGCNHRVRISEQ